MASADVAVQQVGEPVEDEGEGFEEETVVSYPLRVDYCGLCSMPPEVI